MMTRGACGNASQSRPTTVHEDYERQGRTSPFRVADTPTSPATRPLIVAVAQMAEYWDVTPDVAGSNPVRHSCPAAPFMATSCGQRIFDKPGYNTAHPYIVTDPRRAITRPGLQQTPGKDVVSSRPRPGFDMRRNDDR